MTQLDQQIGRRLRIARKACGYKSARAFATKFNIPESTYSQHETGKRSLSPDLLLFYSKSIGINPGWLVTGPDDSVRSAMLNVIDMPIKKGVMDIEAFKKIYLQSMPAHFDLEQKQAVLNAFDKALSAYLKVTE